MVAERDDIGMVAPGTPAMLGEYAVLAKLASGGMATVYVARKHAVGGFERLVAIKLCHAHLRDNQEFVSMFLDEARLAARIHHPNVVATLDVNDDDQLYLVMEYVEGYSLAKLMREAQRTQATLPLEVVVSVMIDALTGLHAAHELRDADEKPLNLVHRDVSPQNILVGIDGVARITDFGIAFAAVRHTVTSDGRIKGKYSYLCPEQIMGLPATRRMDVFSAGIVLWEALTGLPLFRKKDDAGTVNAVLNEAVPPPSSIVANSPAGLDDVLQRALVRDPEARYATAADFAEALERLPIERVSARAVAAYMESTFGVALAERRELIRVVPEPSYTPSGPHSRRSFSSPRHSRPEEAPEPLAAEDLIEVTQLDDGAVLPGVDGDLEQRRLRGLLAALMLLLVGGAIGLLLARSGPEPAPPPAKGGAPPQGGR